MVQAFRAAMEASGELDNTLIFVTGDNGSGFEPGKVHEGLGLSGIRDRAQALNGVCSIIAAPGKGVRIELSFAGE